MTVQIHLYFIVSALSHLDAIWFSDCFENRR